MCQCFLKPYKLSCGKIHVKFDFPNYATKAYLTGGTGLDTSNPALKSD